MSYKKVNVTPEISRCVFCGEEVPEGIMVCNRCYKKNVYERNNNKKKDKDKRDKKYYR